MQGNFVFAQYAPEAYAPKPYESAYGGVIVARGSDGSALGFVDHETGGVIYRYLDPSTVDSLTNAVDAAFTSTKQVRILGQTAATYVCTRTVKVNMYTTSFEGNDCIIDMSALQSDGITPVVTQLIVFDYVSGISTGPLTRKSKTKKFEGFELIGPGKTVANTKGLYCNGSQPGTVNAPRPTLNRIYVHEVESGVGGKDCYYLSNLRDFSIYNCTYGIWQESGADAGECCTAMDGAIDLCYCTFRCDDSSSEWSFRGVSFDYSRQWFIVTAASRINFNQCHIEMRGKNFAGDNLNYILDGSGSDSRAALAGKDCFGDADGDPTTINVTDSTIDVNNSGGAGPYAYTRLFAVRSSGTSIIFKNCYAGNWANTCNYVWSGPGKFVPGFLSRISSNPSMPNRYNHESRSNVFCDTYFTGTLGKEQNWWISLDTNATTPTNKFTATNGSLAIADTSALANATATACTIVPEAFYGKMTLGGTITGTFVPGMIITGTGVTANTEIIGQLSGTTGGAGDYLVSISQTVASTTFTGKISKALSITKSTNSTAAVGNFQVTNTHPVPPNSRVSYKFLIMIPSAGGINAGTITFTNHFCRKSEFLDANGLPQVTERFNQIRFKTIDCSTLTKDVWSEFILEPWSAAPDAPAGATDGLILVNLNSAAAVGNVYIARPHGTIQYFN